MSSLTTTWQELGDKLVDRYARSFWRLPVLLLVSTALYFGPLYFLRGMRFVKLGALALMALAGAAVLYAHPFQAFLLSILLLFSGLDSYVPGPAGAAILFVAVARVAHDVLNGKPFDWGRPSYVVSLAVLCTTMLTSMLLVWRVDLVLVEMRNIALGFMLYVALSHWADRASRVAAVFLVFSLAVGLGSLVPIALAAASGGLLSLGLAGRFGGLGLDPNLHASNLDCTIALVLASMGRLHGWRRWLLAPLLLVLIVGVILAQSRAGLLVLVVLILVSLLRARHGAGLMLGAFAILGLLLLALPDVYWVRFVSLFQLGGIVVDRSLLLRQHAMQSAWQIFLAHPWLGVGLAHLRTVSSHYMLGGMMAHNAFLEVAAGLGIVGLLAYVAWVLTGTSMARGAAKVWRALGNREDEHLADGVLIALLVFCVTAMTLSLPFSVTLWFLLGLANAVRRCAAREAEAVGLTRDANGFTRMARRH